MHQASKYLPKFGKKTLTQNFLTQKEISLIRGETEPLASPEGTQQQINFHNRSKNSNHVEHHPYYFRGRYLTQNLDTSYLLWKNKSKKLEIIKKKKKKKKKEKEKIFTQPQHQTN